MSNQIKHHKLGDEPLVGLYYVSECIKCGWIGSSGELTEDAQCLQPVGDDRCWGDTDEIGADRLLELMQSGAFDKPATLHKSEPVAVLLPFVEKIISKLRRVDECASDSQGVDMGRKWFDVLTHLGLLERIQRSPAYWEITQQGQDALEATRLNIPQ